MNTMCGKLIPPENPTRRGENNSKVGVNSMRGGALGETGSLGFAKTVIYVRLPHSQVDLVISSELLASQE